MRLVSVRVAIVSLVSPLLVACGTSAITSPSVRGTDAEGNLGQQSGVSFADLPLSFIENRGQASSDIEYYLHGARTAVGFSSGGLRFSLVDRAAEQRWGVDLDFVGARPTEPVARGRTETRFSYFTGDPEQWVTGLPGYSRVAYQDLWPGIDLVYSGSGSRLKYSFRVRPGSNPSLIQLAWRGVSGLAVNPRGQLEIRTPAGRVLDDAPYSYQVIDGRRVDVPTGYAATGRSYGFDVGAYDPARSLVIDPAVLVYAGYIGGGGTTGQETGYDVAVDGTGAAYVTGVTDSAEATFPEVGGPDSTYNGGVTDAFVGKLNPAGTAFVYAGYIGGSGNDGGVGIAIDGAGAAYVTGETDSTEATFPDLGGPDTTYNGGSNDAFVAKVNPSGLSLAYAGYIGGVASDDAIGIDVDGSGAAYVSGETTSDQTSFPDGDPDTNDTFPVPGIDGSFNGIRDAFVAKVGPSGGLVNAGYLGGSGLDRGLGLVLDGSGAAYMNGVTESTQATFPEVGGPDLTYNGGRDAFVAKINASGVSLAYAGYIGGLGDEQGTDIDVDGTGAAYTTGTAESNEGSFPDGDGLGGLPGPDASFNGGLTDAYVAKVTPGGTSLAYAGFIGGSGETEIGFGLAVDATGAAFVSGVTTTADGTFPVLNGPDSSYNGGAADGFIAKLNPPGTSLAFSGFIGGSGVEIATFMTLDGTGAAYVMGLTDSTEGSFPDGDGFGTLPGPDSSFNGGDFDAFIVKLFEPQCRGKPTTATGTAGNDTLAGTSGNDVIAALEGNDTVKAVGGKDLVCAGDGKDKVNGGGGKDRLFGEGGKDKLKGLGGKDRLNGGAKRDTCNGGAGTDKASKCEKEKSIP